MEWTRSEVIALARQSCASCFGLGLVGRAGKSRPCPCVSRAIFRACLNRFRSCASKEKHISRISVERIGAGRVAGKNTALLFGLKDEEYMADFYLVARRVLGEESQAWKVFKYHFLLGGDWKLCSRRLRIDRGTFFHEVYRIEDRLGRAFRELEPHALFPLDEYFGSKVRSALKPHPIFAVETEPERPAVASLRFPIRGAAA